MMSSPIFLFTRLIIAVWRLRKERVPGELKRDPGKSEQAKQE
jgi:hypothetical protein